MAIRPAESRQPSSEDMKGNDDNDVHMNDEVLILPLCIITTNLIFFNRMKIEIGRMICFSVS